jgi:hypothetical protein
MTHRTIYSMFGEGEIIADDNVAQRGMPSIGPRPPAMNFTASFATDSPATSRMKRSGTWR